MPTTSAQRTLVKSPPELWAEVSDAEALARHLGEFGDVRITALEPETTVAWEGDRVRGTVALEASGWGTRVTLRAEETPVAVEEPVAVQAPEPEMVAADVSPARPRRRGLWARLFGRRAAEVVEEPVVVVPVAVAPPPPVVIPEPVDEGVLVKVLDDLGAAHHRPFSR